MEKWNRMKRAFYEWYFSNNSFERSFTRLIIFAYNSNPIKRANGIKFASQVKLGQPEFIPERAR